MNGPSGKKVAGYALLLVGVWAAVVVTSARRASRSDLPPDTEVLHLRLGPKSSVRFHESVKASRRTGIRHTQWVKASLTVGDAAFPCRIRLRGDQGIHWSGDKVSLRVRLRGDSLYKGAREFNLIVPHDRAYFLEMAADWWNRRLGLVPARSTIVWVTINGEDAGAYAYVEELGKELLEREGYPFSQAYKGAPVPHGAYLTNRGLAYSLAYYDVRCSAAPNTPQVTRLFAEILDAYRSSPTVTAAGLRRLSHLLDLDKWAKFSAVCKLLGSHPEGPHNVTLYFNSATGLFEPVLRDPEGTEPRAAATFEQPYDSPLNVLTRELLPIPEFRARRDHHLEGVLADIDDFVAAFDGYAGFIPLLDRDPHLVLPGTDVVDPTLAQLMEHGAAYKGFYAESKQVLRDILSSPERQLEAPEVAERLIVDTLFLAVTHPIRGRPGAARLVLRHAGPRPIRLESLTFQGPGADRVVIREPPTTATDHGAERRVARFSDLTLRPNRDVTLTLEGFAGQSVEAVALAQGQRVPTVVARLASEEGVNLDFLDRPVPELFAAASDVPVAREGDRWVVPAGTYTVREPLILPRGPRLVLEAGVRLRFAPGAWLVSYAPLSAEGSPQAPVVLDAQDSAAGWGGVVVLSTRAWLPGETEGDRRSLLRHVAVRGAKGGTLNGITYTGGASFFYSDVTVERSLFVACGGDDALNVKRADAQVLGNLFLESPMDAMDLDWCTGSVRGNLILRPGGDGVDLSGSAVDLVENAVLQAADKAISVGEASRVTATGNVLAGCVSGIASKDRSHTRSTGNTILRCEAAFRAYRKKAIFGGATLESTGDRFAENGRQSKADDESRIDVQGAQALGDAARLLEPYDEGRGDWPWALRSALR